MRTIHATRFGGPDVLTPTTVAEPTPTPGHALIDIAYTDVIFLETQIRDGWGAEYFTVTPPYTPGGGAGGTVRAVGPDTDPAWIGRPVLTSRAHGSYAQAALAPTDTLTAVPHSLDLATATALVHDGATALAVLELTDPRPGQHALITGAAGGMGTLLVQLLRTAGVHVIAGARGTRKTDLLHQLKAETVTDLTDPHWPQAVREATGVHGADLTLDGAPSGGFATVDPRAAQARHIHLTGITDLNAAHRGDHLARVLDLAARGDLAPVIGQTFDLEQAADAHRAIETRQALAKTLLRV